MPEDYRSKAEHYERKAAHASAPRERERLMKLAADYRVLAEFEENQTDDKPKSSE